MQLRVYTASIHCIDHHDRHGSIIIAAVQSTVELTLCTTTSSCNNDHCLLFIVKTIHGPYHSMEVATVSVMIGMLYIHTEHICTEVTINSVQITHNKEKTE